MPPPFNDEELRDGKDEPGVLGGNNVDGGLEARSIRGGNTGSSGACPYKL